MKREEGSIAPLIATYLALVILMTLGTSAVGVGLIAKNRIQGVADAAILFAHDKSVVRGIPRGPQAQSEANWFLNHAPSAQRIEILSHRIWVTDDVSHLELCARYRNLFGVGVSSVPICVSSNAQSFIVESS